MKLIKKSLLSGMQRYWALKQVSHNYYYPEKGEISVSKNVLTFCCLKSPRYFSYHDYSLICMWMYSFGTRHSIHLSTPPIWISLQLLNTCSWFVQFLSSEYFYIHVSFLLVFVSVKYRTRSFLALHNNGRISNQKFSWPTRYATMAEYGSRSRGVHTRTLAASYWSSRPGGPVTRRASQAVVVVGYYV
jgi:hypothetical protein